MKRQGTLVIVDMQLKFKAANNPMLIGAVLKKIRLAKKLGYGIVVVEYGQDNQYDKFTIGDTHRHIEQALTGYKRKTYVIKYIDDGSPQIVEAIEQYRFNRQHVYVCGVNTCACVYATVSGLAKRLPASLVYVLPDACRCTCGCDVRYQVTALRHRHDNVCLAPEKRGITDEYHRPRYEPVR